MSRDEKQAQGTWNAALEEQTTYWKAFVSDLVLGTLRRMLVTPLVTGAAFVVVAYLIFKFSIMPQETFAPLKWMAAVHVFLVYGVVGIACGLVFGATSTVLRKIEELEKGVHLIVDSVVGAVSAKLSGASRGVSVDEFNSVLDGQIREFSKASRSQFRIFSLSRFFSNLFVRNTLRIIRAAFRRDFLDSSKARKPDISAPSVQSFTRNKLLGIVALRSKVRFELLQYAVYVVIAIFLLVLPVLMFLFQHTGSW